MSLDRRAVEAIVRATTEAVLDRVGAPTVVASPAPEPCPRCAGASCATHERRVELAPELATVARLIDHTLLAPESTREQVRRLCQEAARFGFASVCVNSVWVREAACVLAGSDVRVCTVVGFPLGAVDTRTKRFEAESAIANGATEVDMVLDIGGLKGGDEARARRDVASVASACHAAGAILKVIIETALLTEDEKVRACRLSALAGADFVKTSTGFSKGGATAADVALMRRTVGPDVGVKASGGIRDLADAKALIAAGANRLGTSRGVAIVSGQRSTSGGY